LRKRRSLSFYIEKPLYPHNLLLGFGELTFNENQESLLNTVITDFDIEKQRPNAEPFFVEPSNIGMLSVFKRGDVFNRAGNIERKADPKRRKKFLVSLSLDPKLKLEPMSSVLSPTVFEKYKRLSYEYQQQWVLKCHAINRKTEESIELVVPASAIAAFYLPHSCLLKAAMSGHDTNILYNENLTIETIRKFGNDFNYVHLRREMYDIVAPHVGRIYYCDYARKRYSEIHAKSSKKRLPSGKLSLYCAPFVHGNLEWKVEAKPIVGSNQLLVSSIEACSGSYPFKNLVFGRDNDNRGKPKEFSEGTKRRKKGVPKPKNNDESNKGGNDGTDKEQGQGRVMPSGATDSEIEVTHLIFDESELIHQGLRDIKIKKIDKKELKHPLKKKVTIYVGVGEIKGLSHGNSGPKIDEESLGKLESGYRVTSESALKNLGSDNIESSYSQVLKNYILAISNIEIDNLTVMGRRLPISIEEGKSLGSRENIVPEHLRDLKSPAHWVMTSHKKPKEITDKTSLAYKVEQINRCRKFLIFELEYKSNYAYIFEFDRIDKKDSVAGIIFSDGLKKSPRALEKELEAYVRSRKAWKNNSKMLYKQRFAHKHNIFEQVDDEQRLVAMTGFYNDRIQKWINTLD